MHRNTGRNIFSVLVTISKGPVHQGGLGVVHQGGLALNAALGCACPPGGPSEQTCRNRPRAAALPRVAPLESKTVRVLAYRRRLRFDASSSIPDAAIQTCGDRSPDQLVT
jgi:hypothetical protein